MFAGWALMGGPAVNPGCPSSGNVCRHLRRHAPGNRSGESQVVGASHAGLRGWSQSSASVTASVTFSQAVGPFFALCISMYVLESTCQFPRKQVSGLVAAAVAVEVEVWREPAPSRWGVLCSEHLEYPLVHGPRSVSLPTDLRFSSFRSGLFAVRSTPRPSDPGAGRGLDALQTVSLKTF